MATKHSLDLRFFHFAEPDYEERMLGYIYAWSGEDYDGIELKLFLRNALTPTPSGGLKVAHKYFVEIFDKKEAQIKTLPYSEIEGEASTLIIEQALAEPKCPIGALLDLDVKFRHEATMQVPRLHAVYQALALKNGILKPAATVSTSEVKRL